MASTATRHSTFAPSNLEDEIGYIEFDGTEATVEVATGLSEIYNHSFERIGAVDASDAGYPSLSETQTAGVVAVSGGAVTVVRQPLLAAGTLVSEKFSYRFSGKS